MKASGGSARSGRCLVLPVQLITLAPLMMAGCTPPLKPDPHYVVGKPYQAGLIWYYPKESFDFDETGLAGVIKNDATRLTTDGEVFDQTVLAGAHPTIQLPVIARLTNLEAGREVTLRLNDRGSGDPRRLVEVTRRTAELLAFPPDGVARVRLRILPNLSQAAIEPLPDAPTLAIIAAPRGGIETAELPPPMGVRQGNLQALPVVPVAAPVAAASAAPPMRLAETVDHIPPRPGQLMVRLDSFEDYKYAAAQCASMAAAGARIVTVNQGRTHRFEVEIGPLRDVARAEAVLRQALASGIPDARIVVN